MSNFSKSFSLLMRQMKGQEPEPFWMSLMGAFLVMFVLPAIFVLYAVAFIPGVTQH